MRKIYVISLVKAWNSEFDSVMDSVWGGNEELIRIMCCNGLKCGVGIEGIRAHCKAFYVERDDCVTIWMRMGVRREWVVSHPPIAEEPVLQAVY